MAVKNYYICAIILYKIIKKIYNESHSNNESGGR